MIQAQFRLGGEISAVIIKENELYFNDVSTNQMTSIEGLRLSKAGVLKENPDLKDNADWKKISINRFKEHVKKLNGETNKLNYIKGELSKFGYEPLFFQRAGFRPQKFK